MALWPGWGLVSTMLEKFEKVVFTLKMQQKLWPASEVSDIWPNDEIWWKRQSLLLFMVWWWSGIIIVEFSNKIRSAKLQNGLWLKLLSIHIKTHSQCLQIYSLWTAFSKSSVFCGQLFITESLNVRIRLHFQIYLAYCWQGLNIVSLFDAVCNQETGLEKLKVIDWI